jgi:hypothetical protein
MQSMGLVAAVSWAWGLRSPAQVPAEVPSASFREWGGPKREKELGGPASHTHTQVSVLYLPLAGWLACSESLDFLVHIG